jgi:hypothetical protein
MRAGVNLPDFAARPMRVPACARHFFWLVGFGSARLISALAGGAAAGFVSVLAFT